MPTVTFGTGQSVEFKNTPTQKDIDEVATKLGINKPPPTQPSSGGILGSISDQIKSGYQQGSEGVQQIQQGGVGSDKNGSVAGLEGALKVGSGVASIVTSPLAPLFAPIGKVIQGVANKVSDIPAFQKFAMSNTGQKTARVAEDLTNAGNIAGTITGVDQAVKSIPKTIEQVKSTTGILKDAYDANTAKKQAQATSDIVSKRAQEISNIENNYAKTRKANQFSKDAGLSSRQRVASTDVLVNSVDNNGLIRTKQPGGAVEQYKKLTLDKAENLVGKSLEREGSKVKLSAVEKELQTQVDSSGLQGADLLTALKGVKKEIAGLKLRADSDGYVPTKLIHDAKINTTNNINYQTPPEVATYRKSVARAYKSIVEKNSNVGADKINPEIQKYLQDIQLLERLDGARVKGGKLGKYFAQISGNIVGGLAGSAVGGPVGSAIGTVVGGELAGRIKGGILSKTLGKETGNVPEKNPILKKAIETANSPRPMLPAPKENSPRSSIGSGPTINLSERTVRDEGQSKSLGNRNAQYSPKNNNNTKTISDTVPQSHKKSKGLPDKSKQVSSLAKETQKAQNKLDREYTSKLNALANRSGMDDMAFGNFEKQQTAIKNQVYGKEKLLEERQILLEEIKKIKSEKTYDSDSTAQRMVNTRQKSIKIIDNELKNS